VRYRFAGLFPLLFCALFGLSVPTTLFAQAPAPGLDRNALDRMHFMLLKAYEEVQKNYYDPKYHGVDLTASYHRYDAMLDKSTSLNQSFRVIQSFLANLHDSHLYFFPPERSRKMTPGYSMELVGDKCFVSRIRPGTDAATKLHLGDQVLTLDGFRVTPKNFDDLVYLVRGLSGSPQEELDLVNPQGEQRHIIVMATKRSAQALADFTGDSPDYYRYVLEDEEDQHRNRSRLAEFGDTLVWKIPSFEVAPSTITDAAAKAAKHKNVIIDLRGDGGGYIDTLKELLSHCFDQEVKLGDTVTRKNTKPEVVKPKAPFISGNITVLIDHNSASASELFARVLQLEKRAKIIGDHSAGAVMEAKSYSEAYGADIQIFFGFSITSADIKMADGKSLETVGVTPDELLIPTPTEMAEDKDPILSHALAAYGVTLDPVAAGKLFPFEWPRL